jgi:hypothetical protein
MKVFLSSTFTDLESHRNAVTKAIERLGGKVVRMEVFGARPDDATHASLGDLKECDLFVGIYAHRYGSISERSATSITEEEYDYAKKLKKPMFCYIVNENHPCLPSMIENNEPARSKLRILKEKIKKDLVTDDFTTTDNLASKVATSIGHYIASCSMGDYQNLKQTHQNEDIKPIFECWVYASLSYAEYIYNSMYRPSIFPLYVTVSNFQGCDPYGEAKMHLESGYSEINIKADVLKSQVESHNQGVSNYVQLVNDRIKNEILCLVPSLSECDNHSVLYPQSYYLSNILNHFKNAYPDNRITLKIEDRIKNGVSGWMLYSDGTEIAFGDKLCLESLKKLIQEHTSIITGEIKGYYDKIKDIQTLLDGFRGDIKELVPKSKYGKLAGKCEFENKYED